jgi:hypothetical protein
MKTIVRQNYPASNLPEELREGIDPSSLVTALSLLRAPQATQFHRLPEALARPLRPGEHLGIGEILKALA